MIRLSDYVIDFVDKQGVKHIFMVSGGGGMFLIDSLGRHKDIKYVCNHHEQASAMSAEGYQRITGNLGVALVTTGPAGTNAITGVMCAWNDSIPLLVLSGQSNSKFLIGDTGLRQRGVHEADIVRIVSSITKYAITVTNPETIRYHLEKAVYLAKNGRPGPVWIDIPLDIQSAMIDEQSLSGFNKEEDRCVINDKDLSAAAEQINKLLGTAVRPMVIAGHGIRLSGMKEKFLKIIEELGIPVVTTKNAFDLIPDDHPLLAGRIGINGQRAGNMAIQNSDLVISLGSRLAFPTVGYATDLFARSARKIVVDIDENQLAHPVIKVDLAIHADLGVFLDVMSAKIKSCAGKYSEWVGKCKRWRHKYPVVSQEARNQKRYIDSYHFFEVLSEKMKEGDVLVTDQGATFYSFTVAFKVKKSQHAFTNGGFSPMGYGLPAAIGACFANGEKDVVCVHGDGGLEMNIQELQTLAHYKLPVKIFVFNNQGYLSIKHTQTAYFGGFLVGSDSGSGVSCPDMVSVGKAYGLTTYSIENVSELEDVIDKVLAEKGPVLVDVALDPMQPFLPKVQSYKNAEGKMVSKPLEDMYPFLDRKEFLSEMIVDPVRE